MKSVCLLNTRPAHQSAGLSALIKQAGYAVLDFPALQILTQPLAQAPNWSQQDVWVFVSRNAVEHFANQCHADTSWIKPTTKLIAVGAGTAHAIQQQGWPNLQPLPNHFDSEGMLALDALAKPDGLRIGIVRGDGGREMLAECLSQQGAKVQFYEVYKRIAAPFNAQAWSTFIGFQHPVILLTSNRSLDGLLNPLNHDDKAWCQQQPLIVFSQRIADYALQQGFVGPKIITQTASDQAVLDSLISLVNSSGEHYE